MGASFQSETGSSPLSRGILIVMHPIEEPERIIPALAGNTHYRRSFPVLSTDHPRSRGEYGSVAVSHADPSGSSPLSRGIHERWWEQNGQGGIIPALAGNTAHAPPRARHRRDHPRSRGEYPALRGRVPRIQGSSPLSRGIREGSAQDLCRGGIIPALAGNTLPRYC